MGGGGGLGDDYVGGSGPGGSNGKAPAVVDDTLWQAYIAANNKFAEAVSELVEEDDLVWVHDYPLMLLPALLRKRFSYAKVGFFLHVPFPSSEMYKTLPMRTDLLQGLLGADLIGFNRYSPSSPSSPFSPSSSSWVLTFQP
jgi:trehalose-6-phosphate synthase